MPSKTAMRILFAASIGAISFITLATLAGFTDPNAIFRWDISSSSDNSRHNTEMADQNNNASLLGQAALEAVLHQASPIFGDYHNAQTPTSTWMKAHADSTKLVHMNIPGTHDTATWNFSAATRQSLAPITDLLAPQVEINSTFFRCQSRPIIDMLNSGIRAFDLRYALDVTKSYLVFWHGRALQSQTATLEAVLFAFYHWLDDHPSETVLLSLKFEGNGEIRNEDSSFVQQKISDVLTSEIAKRYILQRRDRLGALGEARGKVVLLRRFDLDLLPERFGKEIGGLDFRPSKWTDNGANISLVYSEGGEGDEEKIKRHGGHGAAGRAFIEDYYEPKTAHGSSLEENIEVKYRATVEHLQFAADFAGQRRVKRHSGEHEDEDEHKDEEETLFWTFASSTKTDNDPPDTPQLQALGDGQALPGVNQRLVKDFLPTMKDKRLGLLMLDFFEEPDTLVPMFLGLLSPDEAEALGRKT